MGRPKKNESLKHLKLDLTELADIEGGLREQAEQHLQAVNAAPLDQLAPVAEGLLAEVANMHAAVETRRQDALGKGRAIVDSACRPVLDIYDAICKTIRGRLNMPPPVVESAPEVPADAFEITITDASLIPEQFMHGFDFALAQRYLEHHKGNPPAPIPGVSFKRRAQ